MKHPILPLVVITLIKVIHDLWFTLIFYDLPIVKGVGSIQNAVANVVSNDPYKVFNWYPAAVVWCLSYFILFVACITTAILCIACTLRFLGEVSSNFKWLVGISGIIAAILFLVTDVFCVHEYRNTLTRDVILNLQKITGIRYIYTALVVVNVLISVVTVLLGVTLSVILSPINQLSAIRERRLWLERLLYTYSFLLLSGIVELRLLLGWFSCYVGKGEFEMVATAASILSNASGVYCSLFVFSAFTISFCRLRASAVASIASDGVLDLETKENKLEQLGLTLSDLKLLKTSFAVLAPALLPGPLTALVRLIPN
tara:strand:- start:8168 stop:9109 length:942 start_codon:yes stop_codon:yes gene_type:complete